MWNCPVANEIYCPRWKDKQADYQSLTYKIGVIY